MDTRTAGWQFAAIDSERREYQLGAIDRQGFETKFEYYGYARQVFAVALDKMGNNLKRSEVMSTVSREPREQGVSDVRLEQPEIMHKGEQETNWEGEAEEVEQKDDHPALVEAVSILELNSWNTFTAGWACGWALAALISVAWKSCKQIEFHKEGQSFTQSAASLAAVVSSSGRELKKAIISDL